MNSIQEGFPELTDSFLEGQDIFYNQFNQINFYIEDTDQEHMYFNILKRLFQNIQLNKIFPLNGKANVINHAVRNLGDHTKVHIVDLDFDEILNSKTKLNNLFYLQKYSIENYFLTKNALLEIVREKNPKLKDWEIEALFDLNNFKNQSMVLLTELSCSFIVIQKFSLGKMYFGFNPPRDVNLNCSPPSYNNHFISDYFTEVETLLKEVDARLTLNAQIRKLKKHFRTVHDSLKNIPGEYLLKLFKYSLEKLRLSYQCSFESFCYKLSKECSISELEYLKTEIEKYNE